jgi:hypothetical protein
VWGRTGGISSNVAYASFISTSTASSISASFQSTRNDLGYFCGFYSKRHSVFYVEFLLHLPSKRYRVAFRNSGKNLETILATSNQDRHLLRIDPNWLLTDKYAQFENYDSAVGITEARWNEYRRLFDRNQIKQGIQRQPDSDDAFMRCIVRG